MQLVHRTKIVRCVCPCVLLNASAASRVADPSSRERGCDAIDREWRASGQTDCVLRGARLPTNSLTKAFRRQQIVGRSLFDACPAENLDLQSAS